MMAAVWLLGTVSILTYAGEKGKFDKILSGTQGASCILACDAPEFSFQLPQMAGHFRIGVVNGKRSLWGSELQSVKLTQGKGQLTYILQDKLLGSGELIVKVSKLSESDGLVMEVEGKEIPQGVQLFWSFGGSYGKVLEKKQESDLKPIYCKDNVFSVEGNAFTVYYGESMKLKVIQGVVPASSEIRLSDAHQQASPLAFFRSGKQTDAPALAATCPIVSGEKLYFCLYTQNEKADYNAYLLPALFKREFK
jgi:hypothetical protein